ncbi:MAG TPA: PDZ domain-containing protein [Fimbriimonadaceae bacterium]|nr:PDZ domain-containing protein [Fimbriimonadaceae bacterium]
MSLFLAIAAAAAVIPDPFDPGPNPMLMRHPTMNATTIVFQFAGDLWSVPREGGQARRLTSAPGVESDPYFSPDGTMIAFSGEYDGNEDVFVMPAKGGEPRRLTYHPGADVCAGWTPDGKSVVFVSSMLANTDTPRLFTVPLTGGVPKPLPFPSGTMISYSPDGQKVAYVPGMKWETAWKRYRGGQTYPIWIGHLSDSTVHEIPRKNSNDEQPMWIGDKIYYMSDKRGPVGLYSYDTLNGKVEEEIKGEGFDIKSATAGPDAIVYERLGSINIFNLKTKESRRVPIEINGDFPEVRTEFKDLKPYMRGAAISPSGQRVVIEARGHILTAPASKGDVREINDKQGVAMHDPVWSPDGKTIAYISDETGDYRLVLHDHATGKEEILALGDPPAAYDKLTWSPDSQKIAYTDNRHILWVFDVKAKTNKRVDAGLYEDPRTDIKPRWSSDSKWLTWARDLDNHLGAVFLYNLDSAKVTQITDGLSNAQSPAFDRGGKYLYFMASTNTGVAASYLDMTSMANLNVVSSIYCVVLDKNGANPLQPESDEETGTPEKKPGPPAGAPPAGAGAAQAAPAQAAPAGPPPIKVDLEDIDQRIIALPLPAKDYVDLEAGTPNTFFVVETPARATPTSGGMPSITKFSFSDRKATPFAAVGQIADITPSGDKMLLMGPRDLAIVPTAIPSPPGAGAVDLNDLKVRIDPRKEWRQMYHQVWRDESLYFYAPNMHGNDMKMLEKRYEPFLANICSRDDLNYLFTDMMGEMTIGHMWCQGGDIPGADNLVPGGLLGADYSFENGRYRLTRVYDGESWNPGLYAPLTQPGVHAKAGEYILAIDGQELKDSNDIYELLEGKAGKQVKIKIGPNPDGTGSRECIVVPVASEFALRNRAWVEDNRRLVDKVTGGRVGYVHVPDTNVGGWLAFNRYYFAQAGKDAIIIDERFNHGGLINDYMIDVMKETLNAVFTPRNGKDWPTPGLAIFGPKVMLINQYAGSGGDMFPWLFRHNNVGKLVGKRTWGGLVRAFSFELVDGGRVNAPDDAMFNPNGTWDVENWGVAPDIDVDLDPAEWRKGHDAQLDRAIAEIMEELKTYKPPTIKKPAYPDRTKVDIHP